MVTGFTPGRVADEEPIALTEVAVFATFSAFERWPTGMRGLSSKG